MRPNNVTTPARSHQQNYSHREKQHGQIDLLREKVLLGNVGAPSSAWRSRRSRASSTDTTKQSLVASKVGCEIGEIHRETSPRAIGNINRHGMDEDTKDELKKQIGFKIKQFHTMKGWSRQQAADKLNLSLAGYGCIERGEIDLSVTRLVDLVMLDFFR